MRCLLFTVVAAVIWGHLVSPANAAALATPRPIEQSIQAMSVEEVSYAGDDRGYGYRVPYVYSPGYCDGWACYPPPGGYYVPYVYWRPYFATPWLDPYERPYFATPWVALPGGQ
jgi:hypothetical protein